MPVARSEPAETRVIAHVDLDCFYVQVEQRRHPELKGKPTAVVMYNPWKGGGIIAVGYEARASGVTRNMRGDDARKVCPDINLIQVPTHFGKADLTDYRDAGSEVVAVFSRGGVCQRASIDEVYLDITEAVVARLQQCPPDSVETLSPEVLGTHVVGLGEDGEEKIEVKDWLCRSALFASRSDQLLACGAMIIAELRTTVYKETGFTTSAGIAHNKMLAKLASGMHKPAQQTLIPSEGAPVLLASLPVKKLKGLGGKLGKTVESDLGVQKIGDLLPYSESKLQDLYGTNTGTWLWRVARGMSGDEVESRTLPKSHGCGKTFPGVKALKNLDSVGYWLSELSGELQERLDVDLQQNHRSARLLVCHAACHLDRKVDNPGKPFPSKSCAIRYGKDKIAHDALNLFKRALSEFCPHAHSLSPLKGENAGSGPKWRVTALSISANNIVDASGTTPITQFFAAPASSSHASVTLDPVMDTTPPSSPLVLHASSSGSDRSGPQDKFGVRSLLKDQTCIKDLEVTTSCERYEEADTTQTLTSAIELDDESRQGQNCTDKEGAVDRETDPVCTPKFGVPGSPARCLTELDLQEDPSSTLVEVTEEGDLGLSRSQLGGRDSETQAEAAVIACSPLQQGVVQISDPDFRCAAEANAQEDGRISERSTSLNQSCNSPRQSTISLVQDSDSVRDENEVSENVAPIRSLATRDDSTVANLSSSNLNSSEKSRDVMTQAASANQRVVSAGSSKRLLFQRVDELWEKSRPSTQSSPNPKRSSDASWNYKEDEIDESVLSELPEEIQRELRNQLRVKKPKTTTGRSTISHYFKTNSSTAK